MKALKMFAYAGALFRPGDEIPPGFIDGDDLAILQSKGDVEAPEPKAEPVIITKAESKRSPAKENKK